MEEWYCFKCKEKMAEKDIETSYLKIIRYIPGIKCLKCGAQYVTKETGLETIIKGEAKTDAKMG